jgi:hypothetical protein
MFVDLDNKTITNASATTLFERNDPQNVVTLQVTAAEYERNNMLDTTTYWTQNPYGTSSSLCYSFDQSLAGVNFSVYDLDYHTGTDYTLEECFTIEAFNQGTQVTIPSTDFSIGNFVTYNSVNNSFCNQTNDVPNNSDFGDVYFSLSNDVDSVCISFLVSATDGLNTAPDGDMGISDIEHCIDETTQCTSGAIIEYSDLGYQTDLDNSVITGPMGVTVTFKKIDNTNFIDQLRTDDVYDRGVTDTTGFWSHKAGKGQSGLCMIFNDRMTNLEFSIYDLDYNDDTDFFLGEQVEVKPFLNGSGFGLVAADYTLGSDVVVNGNTFYNKVSMVSSSDDEGDVKFHFTSQVDSVCFSFETKTDAGNVQPPLADIGFSDFVFCAPLVAVPVEWLSFDAVYESGTTVALHWSTASELNNESFTLQRSKDGINYEDIHMEDGAGTTTGISSYSFTDYNAYVGVNYYRIMQTDYDGEYDYSEIEVISISGEERLSVYPNPARGLATVVLPKGSVSEQIIVSDISGNTIYTQEVSAKDVSKVNLDITELRSGIYFVKYGEYYTKLQVLN